MALEKYQQVIFDFLKYTKNITYSKYTVTNIPRSTTVLSSFSVIVVSPLLQTMSSVHFPISQLPLGNLEELLC